MVGIVTEALILWGNSRKTCRFQKTNSKANSTGSFCYLICTVRTIEKVWIMNYKNLFISLILVFALIACKKPQPASNPQSPLDIIKAKFPNTSWIQTDCIPYCDTLRFGTNGNFSSQFGVDSFQVLSIDTIQFYYKPNLSLIYKDRFTFINDSTLLIYCYVNDMIDGCEDKTFKKIHQWKTLNYP